MIDYETFCKIHDCHDRQRLTIAQTARALGLDPRTIATWAARSRFEPRRSQPRGSVLDSFKPRITRLLDTHPYSAQQIFQRLREEGYRGGITILRDYVRRIRPTKRPVYLKLHFAPGECAQVDWGAYGTVAVDNTRRRLSFFVMVLAFSRQMYVEFTVSQTMEHFLACHEHAFTALGGVPSKIMVDNLKFGGSAASGRRRSGVQSALSRLCPPPRLCDRSLQCCPRQREGRVELGVGYVKKNFLHGLELTDFNTIQAAAQVWLDTIANVRIHGETHVSPNSVRKLLTELGYSRQANRKSDEGSSHPDRDAQFEYINAEVLAAQAAGQPVISVDTKKKGALQKRGNGFDMN